MEQRITAEVYDVIKYMQPVSHPSYLITLKAAIRGCDIVYVE